MLEQDGADTSSLEVVADGEGQLGLNGQGVRS